ncbi:MAG: acetyl-CoA C-acetyltransferase [Candidatus Eremiobacteraeota bacterium]|nr:acetyl-CoA C-acetyltransferase [Candidatus Eremiobacteraeota bacterium]
MVRELREAPAGTRGLATALGWYATKHALGIYGNEPPARPFEAFAPAPDDPGARLVAEPGDYGAVAETCTVVYERDGSPAYGTLFALRDDGSRALGKADDPAVMAAMVEDGFLGSPVELRADRSFSPA